MTRARVALVLGVVAALAVVVTAGVAVATYLRDDDPAVAGPLVVIDPTSGARFEVPGTGWEVRGARSRIFYEDARGRPTAVVTGPAVYRDGYCADEPGDSNRGFAGFTDQSFDAWVEGLTGGRGTWTTGNARQEVVLADGTTGALQWTGLLGGEGRCAAEGVEVAMVRAGDVRAVLVADTGEPGTLSHDEIVEILTSLRPTAS